ncbi:MAG: hypothetical protein WD069_09185 [Planctomycetales bacterium]
MLKFTASEQFGLLLVGVGLALLFFYGYVLRREGRQDARLSASQIALLWLLRIGVAVLALVALAKPFREEVLTDERLPVALMLVDESESMRFPETRDSALLQDVPADPQDPTRAPSRFDAAELAVGRLQEKLSRTHRVLVYTFSDALQLLREVPHRRDDKAQALTAKELFAGHPQPTGSYSNMGDALADALREMTNEKISGMVVLSDGRSTGGLPVLSGTKEGPGVVEQLTQAQVPVHAVAFGTEFPLRDLRIDDVIVGAEASHGDVLTFHVKITNQIRSPLATQLTLTEWDAAQDAPEKDADRPKPLVKQISVNRGQHTISISTIPETEGLRKFRLSLPEQEDEINLENNVAEVAVKVVKRTLRVLLIAGEPSREYFYMVPALLRDPIVDLSCYLQSGDVDYTHQGNSVIERLPETGKDWGRYDVAILADVDPNGITTQQLAGLENMVSNGGGLMVVAGRSHGLAKLVQVHAAKIRGLLPVEVDKNLHLDHDKYYETPFGARRTIKGRGHPILLASTDSNLNDHVWSTFDKLDFYWYHPVKGPKPKSIVLLEKSGLEDGQDDTLVATHRYVDGAVLYMGMNSLWRWRYPYESYDYDRLWTRAIRYLGEAKLMGTQQQVALSTDRRSYSPGEDVQIFLRVLDPALLAQLADRPMFVGVSSEQKDQYMVPLEPDPRGEPVYRGTYRARRLGTMMASASQTAPNADSEAKPLFEVAHSFDVKMQSLEHVDTSADLEGMRALASQTGGESLDYNSVSYDALDKIAGLIPTEPQVLRETFVREVWDGTVFLVLFLVLAASELSLRKWWGLL